MRHELTLVGSKINHLPAAVFRLYEILRQNYAGQYEETGDPAPVYDKDMPAYRCDDTVLTPERMIVTVGYEETERDGQFCYAVRIGDSQECADGCRAYESTLALPCGMAFLQQYYYPVRRFLRANPAKYDRVGVPGEPREGMTIAVLDTEMQRPYVIQFSGCLVRYRNGEWMTNEAERLNVYVRLPEGERVDPFVRKVTGLSTEFLAEHGIAEHEALQQIAAFLSQAEIICGHAVLCDIEILRERYQSVESDPVTMPDCMTRDEIIDTQILMECLYDLDGMIKLERAAAMAGVGSEDDVYHDARTDADVTARLYMTLCPTFMERFGVMPVVPSAMMHAPHDTMLLNAILGKRIPVRAGNGLEAGKARHSRGSRNGSGVRRSVHAEQQRRRRIT